MSYGNVRTSLTWNLGHFWARFFFFHFLPRGLPELGAAEQLYHSPKTEGGGGRELPSPRIPRLLHLRPFYKSASFIIAVTNYNSLEAIFAWALLVVYQCIVQESTHFLQEPGNCFREISLNSRNRLWVRLRRKNEIEDGTQRLVLMFKQFTFLLSPS